MAKKIKKSIQSDSKTAFEEYLDIFRSELPLGESFDLLERKLLIGGRRASVFFVDGLHDSDKALELFKYLLAVPCDAMEGITDSQIFLERNLPFMEAEVVASADTEQRLKAAGDMAAVPQLRQRCYSQYLAVLPKLYTGLVPLIVEGLNDVIIMDARHYPARTVEEPEKEKTLRGAKDGFTETLMTNIGLIRRRIRSNELIFKAYNVGNVSKSDVALVYMKDRADMDFVRKLDKALAEWSEEAKDGERGELTKMSKTGSTPTLNTKMSKTGSAPMRPTAKPYQRQETGSAPNQTTISNIGLTKMSKTGNAPTLNTKMSKTGSTPIPNTKMSKTGSATTLNTKMSETGSAPNHPQHLKAKILSLKDKIKHHATTHRQTAVGEATLTVSEQSLLERLLCEFNAGGGMNPFPKVRYTQRPDVIAAHLSEGKIAIIVDNSPTVMLIPTSVLEFFQDVDDYYFPQLTGNYFRFIKLLNFFVILFLNPVFFLMAEYDFAPEVLKFFVPSEEFAIPIFWQFILLEIAVDGLKLASLNTPSSLGASLSVIGALILGEFSIESGWFIPQTILCMAVVALAAFTQPSIELSYAMKFCRIALLFGAYFFGIYGLAAVALLLLIMTASTKTLTGGSYLYPLIPFDAKILKRLIFRTQK